MPLYARSGLAIVFGLAAVSRAVLHAHAAYTLGIWGLSLLSKKNVTARAAGTVSPKIAVLIVAHDESRVIAECVRSLRAQAYPSDRFEVFVVADHCNDTTAEVARKQGALVFERNVGRLEGKPAAVAYGVERILETGVDYDSIAVFDADNRVAPEFLQAVARRLEAGESIVQGFVDAKNADESWVSAMSAIGFWVIDGLVQRPRERLGLSASLMGTGFAARPALFPVALAAPGALADDLEAGVRLALRGVRVAYEPAARTFDERPVELAASLAQRKRWMQGRWATTERWLGALVAATVVPERPIDLMERARRADVALRLLSPSLLFSSVALGSLAGGELALRRLTGSAGTTIVSRALALSALYYLAPLPLVLRHRRSPRVLGAYILQPGFLLRSASIAVAGWFSRRDSNWVRTEHGRHAEANTA